MLVDAAKERHSSYPAQMVTITMVLIEHPDNEMTMMDLPIGREDVENAIWSRLGDDLYEPTFSLAGCRETLRIPVIATYDEDAGQWEYTPRGGAMENDLVGAHAEPPQSFLETCRDAAITKVAHEKHLLATYGGDDRHLRSTERALAMIEKGIAAQREGERDGLHDEGGRRKEAAHNEGAACGEQGAFEGVQAP